MAWLRIRLLRASILAALGPGDAAPPGPAAIPTGIDIEKAKKTHWAYQPLRAPKVPAVKDVAWPLNDVDCFILAPLEARGLKPVEPADKRALLRRVGRRLDLLESEELPADEQRRGCQV